MTIDLQDLISCINQEILGLVEAGCKHIHIDEPVMMRYPEKALSYGLDNLAKCLVGVPDTVTKVRNVILKSNCL